MKNMKYIIIAALFLVIMPNEEMLMAKSRKVGDKRAKKALLKNREKGDKYMTTEIRQLFASPLLNSHFKEPLKAKGTLDKKIPVDIDWFTAYPKSLLIFDESHLVFDCQSIMLLIDIQAGIIKGKRYKSRSMFISATLSTIYSGNNQLELFSVNNFESLEDNYFIPGIGSRSYLSLLIPFEDFFIAGSQNEGNPKYPAPSFMLVSRMYPGSRSHWKLEFEGTIPQPPVSPDGNIYIMEENVVSIIDKDGKKVKEHVGTFSPIIGSIDDSGIFYMVLQDKNGLLLRAIDDNGKTVWEYKTILPNIIQPPVISTNQNIYLVGDMKVECINQGQKSWEYNFPGFAGKPFFVSAASNELLILSKGSRIVCLNSSGKEEWEYLDEDGEMFLTQAIFDTQGRVITASNKNVVIIK